jgi:hypothetical protein
MAGNSNPSYGAAEMEMIREEIMGFDILGGREF